MRPDLKVNDEKCCANWDKFTRRPLVVSHAFPVNTQGLAMVCGKLVKNNILDVFQNSFSLM